MKRIILEVKAYELFVRAGRSVYAQITNIFNRIKDGYYSRRDNFSLNREDDNKLRVLHGRTESFREKSCLVKWLV